MSYKKFNLDILREEINTQYTDMKGIAAIDGHLGNYLWKLCEENGVVLKGWFLLGLKFTDGETIGEYPIRVSAYLIEKETEDETYEQVAHRIGGMAKVEIHKKSFEISYQDLGKYIKRLKFGVLSEMSSNIQDAVFIDD